MSLTSPSNPDLPNFFHDFEKNALKFAFRVSVTAHTLEEALLKAVDAVHESFPAPAVEDADEADAESVVLLETVKKSETSAEFSAEEKDFFENYRPADEYLTPDEMHELTRPKFGPPTAPRKGRTRKRPEPDPGGKKGRWSLFKWLSLF